MSPHLSAIPAPELGVGAVRRLLEGSELGKLPVACPDLDDKIKNDDKKMANDKLKGTTGIQTPTDL